ncbi:tRNA-dihydrouridine(47) synthase [NAD(P)(+)]-like protein [Blattella germanica]|nr:tRNA-dihydrouridine(47) synthase [NAD(P)(+)]-like protein [Blattella germanica]
MDENNVTESKEADSDKTSGIAVIKAEFVLPTHERTLSLDHVADKDKEKIRDNEEEVVVDGDGQQPNKKRRLNKWEKKKLRGQNKARPAPVKFSREFNLCLALVDVLEDEEEPKCNNPKFGSQHLTTEGRNKVIKELYEKFKQNEPKKNFLDKSLQHSLRKRLYNFSKSENVINKYDSRKNEALQKQRAAANKNESVESSNEKTSKEEIENEENVGPTKTGDEEKDKDVVENNGTPLTPGIADEPKTEVVEASGEEVPATNKSETCGAVDWKGKLYLSPLTTVGNLPFRRICKEYGADITCGEMAMATSLLNGAQQEWALVKRHESEDLFGVQLCGNNPHVMSRSAQLVEESAQVDFIDVNLGCPIELVYQHFSGSGLLRREKTLKAVVSCMSDTVDVPLTVKTRTGVYTDKNIAHHYMPKFRDWGASLITIHGRSREQRYTKSADWNYIEECAKLAAPCPVFGNGDVLSYEDYEHAFSNSPSISGVMIGRGALIKPWIFTEIKERRHWDISSSERLDILKKYGVENTRRFLLEWLSFLHRYIPVGLLEQPPQKINQRPPFYRGRDELETLMASPSCADWVRISEMLLGPVPENYNFLPKHKANSWK